jgi:hypothetical protein
MFDIVTEGSKKVRKEEKERRWRGRKKRGSREGRKELRQGRRAD